MSFGVMMIVLCSALLHAGWNASIRHSGNTFHDTTLVVIGAGGWALFFLPVIPLPAIESWPYLLLSVLIHVLYFMLVAASYKWGELSLIYPLMRGMAPVLSMMGAAFIIKEYPSPGGLSGVLLIGSGILVLAGESLQTGAFSRSSTLYALINAGVIALYTLIDGTGVRLSKHALSYTGWMLLLTALVILTAALALQGSATLRSIRVGWRKSLFGGGCILLAYSMVLWAMTYAPIALVAALRESSVLFAAIIAAYFLQEPLTPLRYLSIGAVTLGVIAMKVF